MRNRQIHNDTGLSYLQNWIKTRFRNFRYKLQTSEGARHHKVRIKTTNVTLTAARRTTRPLCENSSYENK